MSVNANCENAVNCNDKLPMQGELKCKFASLKYEQLMSEKYFVETCFSKQYESYSSKQRLIDLFFKIKIQ